MILVPLNSRGLINNTKIHEAILNFADLMKKTYQSLKVEMEND